MAAKKQHTLRLTMAQALVKYLQVQYSERDGKRRRLIPAMFGIFGHGNVAGLGQALIEYGADLPYMQPHNEQSMVHTASGFAKANLRLATLACAASIGPGSTNMITGAATATVNRLPVLLLPADYYATRRQGPVLQQLEHPISMDVSVNDAFRPVSRFFDRITRPEHILTALPEAMRILTDPADTGAAVIALPQDIQAHAYDYPAYFFEERVWEIERRLPNPTRIRTAIEMIKAAQRPMIIAGGGVIYSEAQAELQAFANNYGIPVGETFAGKGAMLDDTAMTIGGFGVTGTGSAGRLMSQADLVICVGTRLTDFTTGSQSAFNNPDVKFISINVNGHDGYKQGALPIIADAREGLIALTRAAETAGLRPNPAYFEEIAVAKEDWKELLARDVFVQHRGEKFNQLHAIHVINQQAQPGDTIITAAGGPPGDLHQLWDATHQRHCHLEFGFSCMGYEIPAGLGVRMAQPEGEVYVMIGDGTYLMQPTELVTSMQEGLKITVIVMNNHGFQIIRRLQMGRVGVSFGNEFRARSDATNRLEGEYVNIDFAKNAESMGAKTWNVSDPAGLTKALAEARQESRTCVIVVEIEPHRYGPSSEVWWDVAPAEVTNIKETQLARQEFEENRAKLQRYHY
ncbi:MAG: 3D-(3,5/4)-trihydroxycyclohexane-1,2-dione acylhydrolase (decyclizing) [Chloroflexota bacterium]|nr:MAG: 3D-(3,5/4)-trihydroxycyclohexane-1,2-dione acylhydrolase (decyclizing) [Chloroflexota bacterium]